MFTDNLLARANGISPNLSNFMDDPGSVGLNSSSLASLISVQVFNLLVCLGYFFLPEKEFNPWSLHHHDAHNNIYYLLSGVQNKCNHR